MTAGSKYANIPQELRDLKQWLLAGADKSPLTVTPEGRIQRASVNRPEQWLTFDQAVNVAAKYGMHIGFVLSVNDPYCVIDLDVKNEHTHPDEPHLWTSQETLAYYWETVQLIGCYTERSRSGWGLHTWVRATLVRGKRYKGIEAYSFARFMICTGDVLDAVPQVIEDRQPIVEELAQRGTDINPEIELAEVAPTHTDEQVMEMARNSKSPENMQKFHLLWGCRWTEVEENGRCPYPSQSEADIALMSMFTFYSPSNEQCRRLFRTSPLGQYDLRRKCPRSKVLRDDRYLNRTLQVIRQRQEREAALLADLKVTWEQAQAAKETASATNLSEEAEQYFQAVADAEAKYYAAAEGLASAAPHTTAALQHVHVATASPIAPLPHANTSMVPFPPGFVGQIAAFVYSHAVRPVPEVAITAALGLVAGIAGCRWSISNTGLNMYLILLARSGVGKEAMSSGVITMVDTCAQLFQYERRVRAEAGKYIERSELASGQALVKALKGRSSFVALMGEFGRVFREMADERNPAMRSLRKELTLLYSASGVTSKGGGILRAKDEDSTKLEGKYSFSLIGDSTPGSFFESATAGMMEDGFMSRFTVIEYKGDRPDKNPNPQLFPQEHVVRKLCEMMEHEAELASAGRFSQVNYSSEAIIALNEFELLCDHNIRRADENEYLRQIWNRAHLKALRISALLAVADYCQYPTITGEHAEWAITLIKRNTELFINRLKTGDVGGDDDYEREKKVLQMCRRYLELEDEQVPPQMRAYEHLRKAGVIPRRYLQQTTSQLAAFRNYRGGSKQALEIALKSAVLNESLVELNKLQLEPYNTNAQCFVLSNR